MPTRKIIRHRLQNFASNIKVGLSPSKKICFIYFNENPLIMMKNAFYFMLKAFSVLVIFKFLSWLFGYVEKPLDKKTMVNFKVYEVTNWTANDYNTHIAQYLKSKGDQTIKQLTEYNMRNIFLEKSYTKCGGETCLRPFRKKSKLSISLDQRSEILQSLFSLYVLVEICKNILKLSCSPLAFTVYTYI